MLSVMRGFSQLPGLCCGKGLGVEALRNAHVGQQHVHISEIQLAAVDLEDCSRAGQDLKPGLSQKLILCDASAVDVVMSVAIAGQKGNRRGTNDAQQDRSAYSPCGQNCRYYQAGDGHKHRS